MSINVILFLFIAFIGSVVSGVLWFWAVPIVLGFSTDIMDIKQIVAFMSIYLLAGNLSKAIIFFKFVDWKLLLKIIFISMPFSVIGAYYMIIAPVEIIKVCLWIFLIFFSFNKIFSIIKIKKIWNYWIFWFWGLFWFVDGVIWAGWAVLWVMLSYIKLSKESFVVMIALPTVITSLVKIFIFSSEWFFKKEDIFIILCIVIIAFIWTYISKIILKFIKPELFEKIILILLILMWMKLIFS